MTKKSTAPPHLAHKLRENTSTLAVLGVSFVLAIVVCMALIQRNRTAVVSPLGRARYAYEYTPESGGSKLKDLLAQGYITQKLYEQETSSYDSAMECGYYADLSYVYGSEEITGNTATVSIAMNGDDKRQGTTHWVKTPKGWALDSVDCSRKALSDH